MRHLFLFLFLACSTFASAQNLSTETFKTDSVLLIHKAPEKGFHNDYIIFIPKGMLRNKDLFLLVEPNNTGKVTDSMEVHEKHAIALASVSSVGNNISTELKIPLLVPVFPRPASKELTYTHALDRDVMEEKTPALHRLDLQLLAMVEDAKKILASMNVPTKSKFFMSGFSASGTFTNRFSFLHPEKIQALAIGGFNGELIMPLKELNTTPLLYPIGIADMNALFGKEFDLQAYQNIPQYIFMGQLDDNDAVQFDDAYSETERKIINTDIGSTVQTRYIKCQEMYKANGIHPIFKTYENIGHWTTSKVNLDVIYFFMEQMKN
ncbi:MAG: hypothetical protein JNL24_02715 [Bacteroidia bacterium]|nr:hypothetical protein [Bacteroidia bacterium]